MKKFKIGERYLWPALFIPAFFVEVISRTDKTVTFEEIWHPEEKIHCDICYDIQGNEVVVAWEYDKQKGYVRA